MLGLRDESTLRLVWRYWNRALHGVRKMGLRESDMPHKSRSEGGSNQSSGRSSGRRQRRARIDAKAEELMMEHDDKSAPEHKLLDALELLREYIEKIDGSSHLRNAKLNIEAHLYEKGTLKRPE